MLEESIPICDRSQESLLLTELTRMRFAATSIRLESVEPHRLRVVAPSLRLEAVEPIVSALMLRLESIPLSVFMPLVSGSIVEPSVSYSTLPAGSAARQVPPATQVSGSNPSSSPVCQSQQQVSFWLLLSDQPSFCLETVDIIYEFFDNSAGYSVDLPRLPFAVTSLRSNQ